MTRARVSRITAGLAANTRTRVSRIQVSVPAGAGATKARVSRLQVSVAGGTATKARVSRVQVSAPPTVEFNRTQDKFFTVPGEIQAVQATPRGVTIASWSVEEDPDYGIVYSGSNGNYTFEAPYDKDGAEFDVLITGTTAGGVSGTARIHIVSLPHNRWRASAPGVWDIPVKD